MLYDGTAYESRTCLIFMQEAVMCVACACSQRHSVSSCGIHDNAYNKTRYNTRTERLVERMYAQASTEPVV